MIGGLTAASIGLKLYALVPQENTWQANLIIGVGLILFLFGAIALKRPITPGKFLNWLSAAGQRMKITPAQSIYLLLALLLSFSTFLAAGTGGLMRDKYLGLGCWLAAISLLVFGTLQADSPLPRPSWKTLLAAFCFFAVSAVIRTFAIENIPPLLNGDEASAGLSAVSFLENNANNIFGVSWFSFPSLYFYLQSFSIRLFGQTTFAIRFPSAMIGGLTVAAVYLIGRRMFSPRAGLLAGIFLSGSHFHNHFSRIALNNIYDAFWYILALGMLWDGWKNQRRSSYLIAGLSFGLAQYFYASSRFLLGIIPLWLLVTILIQRRNLSGNITNLALLLFAFVIVTLPLILFYIEKPDDFFAPFNRVESFGDWLTMETQIRGESAWRIMAEQILDSARTYITKPSEVWYRPNVPILQPLSAGLFTAGVLLSFFYLRRARTYLLLIWIGSFILIGGLSVPVSAAQRYVAALPACALLIGFALDESANLLQKVWKNRWALLSAAVIVIAVAVSANDLYFYFFKYAPTSDLGGLNTLVAQRLAEYLEDKEDLQVAFFGQPRMGYYSINSTAYLAPHIQGFDFNHPWGSADNPELTADKILFIFLPGNEEILDLVKQDYPNGSTSIQETGSSTILYWLYTAENPNTH